MSVIEKLPDPEAEATKAGNYFIANYPPFSFWKEEEVPGVETVLDLPPPEATPLGIYHHIPFCRKRCHFCYFRVYTDKNAEDIRRYLDATIAELEAYGSRPYLQGRKPQFVYFGGGTPSYLSARQLASLTERMKDVFPWDDVEEVTFECEPGTLNEKKLEAIRGMGVTRLSLGIENFDDHILETNGRAHRSGEVYRAYGYARDLGFPQINIDLIAGMLEETEENWVRCVEKTIELDPDCVTIYQMEIPFNTTIYKEMREEGKLVAPVADWQTKREWVNYAFQQLEKAGYTINSGVTAVKDAAATRFVYRESLWTGADLLALGVASFGHLGGTHYQNITHIGDYVEKTAAGRLPLSRALFTTAEERMIREFILQMKLGHVSFGYFQEKFQADLAARFRGPFQDLVDRGLADIDPDPASGSITLRRHALLRVDSLLHAFFLPQHQNARYT